MLTETLVSASRNIPLEAYHSFKRPRWSPTRKAASRRCEQFYRVWFKTGRPHDSNRPAWASYKQSKREFRAQIRRRLVQLFRPGDGPPLLFPDHPTPHLTSASRPVTNYTSVSGNNFEGPRILEGWAEYFESLGTLKHNISGGLNRQAEISRLLGNLPRH